MNATIKLLGFALLITLAAWIGLSVSGQLAGPRLAPRILPVGSAFEGSVQLPKEDIDREFNAASARMDKTYQRSEAYRTASEIVDWCSFLCTALITLLAGYFGVQMQSAGSTPDVKTIVAGRSAGFARTVGLLAGLAAVMTGASSRAKTYSEESYKSATEMRDTLATLRKNILDAKDAPTARSFLDSVKTVR